MAKGLVEDGDKGLEDLFDYEPMAGNQFNSSSNDMRVLS